jgi:hypothetical protein
LRRRRRTRALSKPEDPSSVLGWGAAAKCSAGCKQGQRMHLHVRPGLIFPSRPCNPCGHGAQGRVKVGRRAAPRRGLDISRPHLGRPSTVLGLREAVPILRLARFASRTRSAPASRLVMCRALAPGSAGAGATRMGGNRVSGFRRAAIFGRTIARDPSPAGARGPPNGWRRNRTGGLALAVMRSGALRKTLYS